MADVNIKIDIDADTSAIDRVRAKLISLCREVDDCTDTMDKHTKSIRELSGAEEESHRKRRKHGDGFDNQGKKANKLTKFLKGLAKFGFKYLAIESLAALAVIGSAGILFKTGQLLARGYQMALSGVAYAMTAIVAAGAAALASMRQFQAVQFAPSFSAGAINTDDPMRAASAGMKMFIDDQEMAVLGTKGLTSAFKTLNDQQQVTGKTTAVFRELSNYTAGMGGDMEKGSQAMAKFLAQFQKDKTMTEAVKTAGKELGPGFEKILNEANKLGLTTYEKFTEAALRGELGDTFSKYAGQLDAVNSTVIGKFKQGFASIKNLLVEVGEPLLGPLTQQIPRVVNIIEGMILTIRHNVETIGKGSLLEGLVNGFEKVAIMITRLVTRDLGGAGKALDKFVSGWRTMMGFFERIQDYMRELVPASEVLGRVVMNLLKAFGGSLGERINNLSQQLTENEDKFISFTKGFQNFMQGFAKLGSQITNAFIQALPVISALLTILGKAMQIIAKFIDIIMTIAGGVDKLLNPILAVVDKITFGFISLKDVVKSLTAAVIALGVAMLVSSKIRGGVGGFMGFDIGDLKSRKKGKLARAGADKAGGLLKRGGKAGGRIAGRGIMSGLQAAGGGSAALGASVVAGSATAGYFAGNVGDLFNANTKKSRAAGALAGAGAGAASGALVGAGLTAWLGPGAAAGAVAGAIIGGIVGGIKGFVKAGEERRKFDNAAKDILKQFGSSLDDAVKKGDTKALKEAAEKANKEYMDLLNGGKYGIQAYNAKLKELEELNRQANNAFANFTTFEMFFGDPDKLNEELKKQGIAADEVKNQVLDIFQIMRQGGHDVASTWDAVMGEFNQKLLDARLAMFDLPLKTIEMQEKVNAAQQRVLDGDTSDQSIISFLKDAFEYSMNLAQGDVTQATVHFQKTIEKVSGPGGSMNKVAEKLKKQTDALNLFDPKTFAKQIIATGQTEAQGRTIETLTGGMVTAGAANVEIQRRLHLGGAKEQERIDELLRLGVTGNLTDQDIMQAFAGDSQMFTDILKRGKANEQERAKFANMSETKGVAAPSQRALNIGGVNVNVTGFISDKETAQKIAKIVQAEIAKREGRAGASASTVSPGVDKAELNRIRRNMGPQ